MKILLINGSPHRRGCVYTALEEIAKTLEEENIDTEILQIGREPVTGMYRLQLLPVPRAVRAG